MNRKYSFLLSNLLFVFCFFISILNPVYALEINKSAPNFTLKSRSGKNLKLSEYRGQVVLINFWASWCGPCRAEMPELEKLYKRYKSTGFVVFGVNVDDNKAKANELLAKIPVSFPVLFDTDKKITEMYQVDAMPSTYFVDRDGNLRSVHKGYLPDYASKYDKEIKKLLKE